MEGIWRAEMGRRKKNDVVVRALNRILLAVVHWSDLLTLMRGFDSDPNLIAS